jgi:AraC family transcriptional regulator
MTATRVSLVGEGARATCAGVGPFEIQLLTFAPGHSIEPREVERGYVVSVLGGSVAKTFPRADWALDRDSLAVLPAGASHHSRFGRLPTRVITIRGRNGDEPELAGVLRRFGHVRATASTAVAARLAGELHASDASWPLAVEGLALQLLAIAGRAEPRADAGRPRWLRAALDLLHERTPAPACLSEVAREVGVPAARLARTFRREYGLTVGEYSRTLRLEWAASQLGCSDLPLARIAAGAGFADQSHFTRAFRAWSGTTPGRYRELVRR